MFLLDSSLLFPPLGLREFSVSWQISNCNIHILHCKFCWYFLSDKFLLTFKIYLSKDTRLTIFNFFLAFELVGQSGLSILVVFVFWDLPLLATRGDFLAFRLPLLLFPLSLHPVFPVPPALDMGKRRVFGCVSGAHRRDICRTRQPFYPPPLQLLNWYLRRGLILWNLHPKSVSSFTKVVFSFICFFWHLEEKENISVTHKLFHIGSTGVFFPRSQECDSVLCKSWLGLRGESSTDTPLPASPPAFLGRWAGAAVWKPALALRSVLLSSPILQPSFPHLWNKSWDHSIITKFPLTFSNITYYPIFWIFNNLAGLILKLSQVFIQVLRWIRTKGILM